MKTKMSLWKKILIAVFGLFIFLFILSKLFPINYYETGIEKYNKQNFKEALEDFNNVELTDTNYNKAVKKIKEIQPIVDSLEKIEQHEVNSIEKPENNKDKGIIGVVGQSYNVGQLTYKVERVKYKKFIGGVLTLNKADGIFLIITLTITNKSKEEIVIDNSFFQLTDESGYKYEYSPDATASLELSDFPGETFFGMSLNPNVTKKGKVVFELPTKKKSYNLLFNDPFSESSLELNINE